MPLLTGLHDVSTLLPESTPVCTIRRTVCVLEPRLYKARCIAVVVPAYNEEGLISSVIGTMPACVDHIIVVDDCSKDDTRGVVARATDARVVLLSTPRNSGVGGATIVGFKHAISLGAAIIVKMDGDGQMDPEYLPTLLDALIDDGYDYAKGNRFLIPDFLPVMPKHRLLGNMALTFMTKLATGYWNLFDPQNGYVAIKTEAFQELDPQKLHPRFFFENDMLVQLSLHNARVKDVPIPARYGSERSSLNPLQVVVTFPLLLHHRFWRRIWHNYVVRDFNPIALFLFLGLGLMLLGGGFGIFSWIRSSITGEFASTGTVMLSVLPVVIGFQLLLQAIVLDIQRSPR